MAINDVAENDQGGAEAVKVVRGICPLLSPHLSYDQWHPIPVPGWRPPARYKHAAEVVSGKLYVIGGRRNGRYLSDIQEYDIMTSTWMQRRHAHDPNAITENDEENGSLPAIAGHSLVKWDGKLLLVAGLSKRISDTVTVWSIDLATLKCTALRTHGDAPVAREGQSVTLVGAKLIMFGGEDKKRIMLNDLHILDLETLSWSSVETRNLPPSPRSDHTAAAYEDRYLLIFGGSTHSVFFSDLHILDLCNMEWSEIQIQGGEALPRAGHAAATVGEAWYIAGGGDNKNGARETVKLNLSKFVLEVTTTVSPRDPLASEGLSLCSTTINGESILLAFGGYNGKYHNEVFVLKTKPTSSTPPKILRSSAAAAAAASVSAVYALTSETPKGELLSTKVKNSKETETEVSPGVTTAGITSSTMEKEILEFRLLEAKQENEQLRSDLNDSANIFKELSMELQSIHGQLESERMRCTKLELQITEIQKRLESQQSIEHDVEVLWHETSREKLVETGKQVSGVWPWMRGSN